MTTAPRTNHRRAWRISFRTAYSKFSLLLLAITIVSLLPHYVELIREPENVSLQLIVHGIVFLLWYLLFSVQSGLVSGGQLAVHRKLGYASIPFAVLLLYSGGAMLIGVMKSYQPDWSEDYLFARTSFVWAIAHTVLSFAVFYVLAVIYRASGQAHKRFMLLASLSMMSASITRFAFLPIVPIDGTAFTLLLTYALLITPLVIDRVQHGKIHPVLLYGTVIYVVTQLLAMALLPATTIGQRIAFPF